jgi:glutamate-1-semialdehyde 2,1-aminomutase
MSIRRAISSDLQKRASRVMPLGVSSNVRYWGEDKNLYIDKAKGAYIWDVDGNRYLDYRLAFGPVILGYAYDDVDNKVCEAIRKGVSVGLTREIEISAAERVVNMCPGVEMVRFVNSGTEATMHALRVARAFTGRDKIIKFEGGYHGAHDYVLFSTYAPPSVYGNRLSPIPIPASSGIPGVVNNLIITLPFNDREILENALKRSAHEVAAIITEPMLGNFGSIDPEEGFMQFLRDKCNEYDILLLVDEVKTGFRVAPGGAAEVNGVIPDMTMYAKSIGNGYPIAAYGGRREIMSILGKGVTQGGTYSGNIVGAAAIDATLSIMQSQPVHKTIIQHGQKLQEGLREIFEEAGIKALLSKYPSIFSISFGVDTITDARNWANSDHAFYKLFMHALLERGILIDDDPREPWCLSYSHSDSDVDETLNIVKDAIYEVKTKNR